MKTIPVAIAFDSNYLMPACVMLTSLFKNASETTRYDISTFIDHSIIKETKHRFDKLFAAHPEHTYRLIDPQGAFLKTAQNKGHLTTPNYYRFLMPDFMPNHNKAFWIDVDIIVKNDLSELYEMDLGNNYVGAVAIGDPASKVKGIPFAEYYNAGFMLVNLDLWRKDSVAESINQMIAETEFNCPTQDPCNLATHRKTHYLPFKYNTLISSKIIEKQDLFLKFNKLPSFKVAVKEATILHFVDKTKPWIFTNQPFFDEWKKYYDLSIYKNEPLRRISFKREEIKRFLYQKKRTTKKRTIIKICKIPVYAGK